MSIFEFDPELTNLTVQTVQDNIKAQVVSFFNDNLGTFNKVFRQSNLIATIDQLSPAILNSSMQVKIQSGFTPAVNVTADYEIPFPVALFNVDDDTRAIQTTSFTFQGSTCIIRSVLNSTTLENI